MRYCDLTGRVFGRLTCIEYAGPYVHKGSLWKCRCVCGEEVIVQQRHLSSGHTQSCGCLQKERIRNASITHGLSRNDGKVSRLYSVWVGIKNRCFRVKSSDYKHYGGRGITICSEWLEYKPFHDWAIAAGYKEGLSIDRINNDGNYDPANCRWVPMEKQFDNRRSSHFITFNGETKTVTGWAKSTGISRSAINSRLRRGWAAEEVLVKHCKEDGDEAAKA